jgi:hypothetical protein
MDARIIAIAMPIAILAIALVLSIVQHVNTKKPAKITLSVGEWMKVFHGKDLTTYIHLPIVFQNTRARSGVVRSLGLILRDPKTKEAIFIKWMGFLKPDERSGGKLIWESDATPFSVAGASDVIKVAEFYGAESVAGWLPKPITYELYLLAWTSVSKKPSKKLKVNWTFNEKDVSAMKKNLKKAKTRHSSRRWIIRSSYAPVSKKLSASEFNNLVN